MTHKQETTLQELTQLYLQALAASGKSPRTLYTYGKGTPEIVIG